MSTPEPKKSSPRILSEAEVPILTEEDPAAVTPHKVIPELVLSDELDPMEGAQKTKDVKLVFPPELLLDDVLDDSASVLTNEAPLDFNQLPSLDLEGSVGLASDEFALPQLGAVSPTVETPLPTVPHVAFEDISSITAALAQAPELPSEAEASIPDLMLDDVLPASSVAEILPQPVSTAASVEPPLVIPELALEDRLDETAVSPPSSVASSSSVHPSILDKLPVLDEASMLPAALLETVQSNEADEKGADIDPIPALDDLSIPTLAEHPPKTEDHGDDMPGDMVMSVMSTQQATHDDVATQPLSPEPELLPLAASDDDWGLDGGLDGDLTLSDLAPEAGQVEVPTQMSDGDLSLPTPQPSAGPMKSIPLESLPRGVLGGMDVAGGVLQALDAKLAEKSLEPPLLQQQDATAVPVNEPVSRPVEIINVAGLASSNASPATQPPPAHKSYVALIDESMLIDSLYDRIMPRMKVELSLWLQDALENQSKQMLSGVMHQLKEDYEMLFSETLRESLRQAIAEMRREDRH